MTISPQLPGGATASLRSLSRLTSSRIAAMLGGLAVSIVAAWLATRGVHWAQLKSMFGQTRWDVFALGGLSLMAANCLRAARWQILIGRHSPPRKFDLLSFIMIGYLVNALLPLPSGDVARMFLLRGHSGLSASSAAATIVAERGLDVLTLIVLFIAAGVGVALPESMFTFFVLAGVMTLVIVAMLVLVAVREDRLRDWAARRLLGSPAAIVNRLGDLFVRFVEGLHPLRNVRSMSAALALSLMIRATEILAIVFALGSIGVRIAAQGYVLVNSLVMLGLAIPAGPGAVGSFELFGRIGLGAFGVSATAGLVGAIAIHSVALLMNVVFGALATLKESMAFRRARRSEAPRVHSNPDD
jgi:uncharacterized protein (TIRG00374 family)